MNVKCEICGEYFDSEKCHECDLIGECFEFHYELSQGITKPPSKNISACGNLTPVPEEDAQHFSGISDRFVKR